MQHPRAEQDPEAEKHAPECTGNGMTFAARLQDFGDNIALIGEQGERLSYAGLARRADAFAAEWLGTGKRLVLVQSANDVEGIIRYIAALRAGHAVILTGDDFNGKAGRIVETYAPDVCISKAGEVTYPAGKAAATIVHPDLALCLSTSGSTGATRMVRLSGQAVHANALSIAEYLQLGADERAISSLPLHYSYGLSLLHSHLACGAAIVLTGRSLTDPEFWDLFRREQVTSLAGVPHSFELLDAVDFRSMDLPSLRYLTQAGGRLAPELVLEYGRWAEDTARRFYVMYGQTEAAPRMGWMPPARLLEHPDCIGLPVPGGSFALVDEQGQAIEEDGVAGELVYRGPNVMMGYATSRDDLVKRPEVEALYTGDMAERRGDLYRIVGRRSRFVKPFGLRISLDELESRLAAKGWTAAAAGNDGIIAIACRGEGDADALARELGQHYGLPAALFDVAMVEEWPRLASGKTDYPSILRAAEDRRTLPAPAASAASVAEAFKALLGRQDVRLQDSFISLEGDSLSYVAVASELDRRLGYLPDGWEHLTVAEIDALAPAEPPNGAKPYDSEMLLRAAAISGVVANHASSGTDWHFGGGADVLMLLVGFSLARFNFGRLVGGQSFQVLLSVLRRIILPYCLILCAYGLFHHDIPVSSFLLLSNFEGRFRSFLTPYWFMEALLQSMVLIALLFSLKRVRTAAAEDPFEFGLWFLGGAVALKVAAFTAFHHAHLQNMTPDAVLPLIGCGWLLFFAKAPGQKLAALGATCGFAALHVAAPALGGWDYATVGQYRLPWLLAVIAALLYVPRVPLPPLIAKLVTQLSAASFTIYLVHVLPVHLMKYELRIDDAPLTVLVAISAGLAVHRMRPGRVVARLLEKLQNRAAAAFSD